jgi:Uma2 family endonuclease
MQTLDQLNPNQIYSYADYLTWQFVERIELLKGYIRQMAAPNRLHQTISGNLFREIAYPFKGHSCRVFAAPFDVKLVKNPASKTAKEIYTVVQPDICVICDRSKLDEQGCMGSPDFIIEIVSESTAKRDIQEKFELYEENGVLEYWIVRPYENTVQQFYLENDKYQYKKTYVETDKVSPILFPDLVIDLEEVFAE